MMRVEMGAVFVFTRALRAPARLAAWRATRVADDVALASLATSDVASSSGFTGRPLRRNPCSISCVNTRYEQST